MKENINKILVVGIGGAGANMVKSFIKEKEKKTINHHINTMIIDTDHKTINKNNTNEFHIGTKHSDGYGTGMDPLLGEKIIKDYENQLEKIFLKYDLVIITAGLGGGTGSGMINKFSEILKKTKTISIFLITTPFSFEGNKRNRISMKYLRNLKISKNVILTIDNNNLFKVIEKNTGIQETFQIIDNLLIKTIFSIINIIMEYGENDINLDLADIQTILEHKGETIIGYEEIILDNENSKNVSKRILDNELIKKFDEKNIKIEKNDNPALLSLKKVINQKLLNSKIENSKGIIVKFDTNPNFPLLKINESMEYLESLLKNEVDIVFGTMTNENLSINSVRTTIIATGC
jgi:cell division protein FtsZ